MLKNLFLLLLAVLSAAVAALNALIMFLGVQVAQTWLPWVPSFILEAIQAKAAIGIALGSLLCLLFIGLAMYDFAQYFQRRNNRQMMGKIYGNYLNPTESAPLQSRTKKK